VPFVRAGVDMALETVLDREAARYFERLDRVTQERIASKLDALAEHPNEAGSKPLHGYPGRAARVEGLRLVYRTQTPACTCCASPRGGKSTGTRIAVVGLATRLCRPGLRGDLTRYGRATGRHARRDPLFHPDTSRGRPWGRFVPEYPAKPDGSGRALPPRRPMRVGMSLSNPADRGRHPSRPFCTS